MHEAESLQRQAQLVAATIEGRVQRIHDALEGLSGLLKSSFGTRAHSRDLVAQWIADQRFVVSSAGFFERESVLAQLADSGGRHLDGWMLFCTREALEHGATGPRMHAAAAVADELVALLRRIPGVAWVYYTDAGHPNACLLTPRYDWSQVLDGRFDWHAYHSFTIATPVANPERTICWSKPNIDYGAGGLISCVSKPLWLGDEFVGVCSIDVRLNHIHGDVGAGRTGHPSAQQTFVITREGMLLSHPSMQSLDTDASLGSVHTRHVRDLGGDFATLDIGALLDRRTGHFFATDARGIELLVGFECVPAIGWVVFTALPRTELVEAMNATVARAFERLGRGDLEFRIDAGESDLMRDLAGAYNSMAAALEESVRRRESAERETRELATERERMSRELEIAASIQAAMLPRPETRHPEIEFAGIMEPAEEVGGDFYDVILGKGDEAWITIGDVSSHGLGAGLVMMIIQTAFESLFEAARELPIDEVLRRANRIVYRDVQRRHGGGKYATASLLVYRGAGVFDCVGSHLWPLVVDTRTGEVRQVEVEGPWLGVVEELADIPITPLVIRPHELLCLYSDGVIEATGAAGAPFDLHGLEGALRKGIAAHGDDLGAIGGAVLAEVAELAPRRDDDRTLLLIRCRPT
jgi:serine phosphatase RsbU (regulator of sigma subunit)